MDTAECTWSATHVLCHTPAERWTFVTLHGTPGQWSPVDFCVTLHGIPWQWWGHLWTFVTLHVHLGSFVTLHVTAEQWSPVDVCDIACTHGQWSPVDFCDIACDTWTVVTCGLLWYCMWHCMWYLDSGHLWTFVTLHVTSGEWSPVTTERWKTCIHTTLQISFTVG